MQELENKTEGKKRENFLASYGAEKSLSNDQKIAGGAKNNPKTKEKVGKKWKQKVGGEKTKSEYKSEIPGKVENNR